MVSELLQQRVDPSDLAASGTDPPARGRRNSEGFHDEQLISGWLAAADSPGDRDKQGREKGALLNSDSLPPKPLALGLTCMSPRLFPLSNGGYQ